ncbi:MAG: endolytic transglycosylase MltG [Candidatus Caldatribacteriota bacterium]|jgi:UPF0755 protein|nr:endolytic transglycosylase MltG [Atribacterota bacterium]MDD3641099.1 endolytic transglycosylase MltG [Atribacterota bacterium]MDD4289239.1 endolytic transglycosylase MltG [Atribacterota bacterium]MDD4765601.1 endolytic transglycosylase MltG [Atribacterota bacterium]MDD5635975.1 endolytic transglycosylase MltG [Atribacterota bacterium]
MIKFLKFLIFLIAVLFLLALFVAVWILVPLNTTEITEKTLIIPYEYNSARIRHLLEEEKIIRPGNIIFQLMTRTMKIDDRLQSGEYNFSSAENLLQIIDKLEKGKVVLHRITIPEGYQSKQIAGLLSDNEIADYEQLMELILEDNEFREGFLFPDTYTFPKNYGAYNVLKTMSDNFKNVINNHIDVEMEFPFGLDFHKVIILASIIEKEAQGKEDKPKIASVFYNRLKDRMMLQSCATVQYLLEKPREILTHEDLQIDSPFNTYLYYGLPPAPICNPGLDSILAAVYPAQEDFLYFVLGADGEHVFTRTYQEHLDNKP